MDLKIVSFNIRYTDDLNGHSIRERAPRLAKAVCPLDPDIIGFQEYRPAWEEYIDKYFLDKYDMFFKYRNDIDIEAAPLLWKKDKFDCLKTGYFWLSDTPETESNGWDDCGCYRICTYGILRDKKTGKTFTFMNTHLGFGDKWQVKSAELIYEYSKRISDHPTVITGDFNMSPESIAYKAMTAHFTDVNAATVNDLRNTFHDYKKEGTGIKDHIDYCFVTDDIRPIDQKIIDKTFNGKFPSDHYGLEIDVEI
ncbi:MAG: hypothetical protein IKZ47_03525 [Clostridia bacterium]|nr:hypothetical protein [Clostridia bacterium]